MLRLHWLWKPTRWLLVAIVGLVVTVVIAGNVYRIHGRYGLDRDFPAPGRLVSVGTHRMHIHCVGSGQPTVVLDAGAGAFSSSWGAVLPKAALITRVCVFDRRGLGWSERGPGSTTAESHMADLEALLAAAREPGPYIFGGWSMGGALAWLYTQNHLADAAGLIMVDAMPRDMLDVEALGGGSFVLPPGFGVLDRVGLLPAVFALTGDFEQVEELLHHVPEDTAGHLRREHFLSGGILDEIQSIPVIVQDARQMSPLGDLPLIVIAHGQPGELFERWGDKAGEAEELFQQLQREMATQSSNGKLIVAESSDHAVPFRQPEIVVEAIRELTQRHRENRTAEHLIDLGYGVAEAKTVAVNDTDLTYITKGAGPPVVFVHGQLSDFRFWKASIEEAARRHLVVAYSRRYFFPNPSSQSVPEFRGPTDVPDLIAFIEALDIAPVHLVGHSSGGHAALLVAIQRPDLVRSLVLAEGGFMSVPGIGNAGADASRTARVLLEQGQDEEAIRTFIDTVTGPGAFDRMAETERQANLDNRMALGLPVSPSPTCDDVGSIAAPTLIVRGDSSPMFVHAMMDALVACLPAARQVTIANASHAMFLDDPSAFNAAVLRFIDGDDP